MSSTSSQLTLLNLFVLLCLAYSNFNLKTDFRELKLMTNIIDARIKYEQQLIATLNAELVYISSPKYLQKLADKYLNLEHIKSTQIVEDLPHALERTNKVTK